MNSGLPSPATEDKPTLSRRTTSTKKSSRSTLHRGSKRTSTAFSNKYSAVVIDGQYKRAWKACERCRMKKTKCNGESPCKRCKDDGLVCTARRRKRTEFKQLPIGYAELLENNQYVLIATVQKIYTMVRNNEPWLLGEPELNDRGLPVIHNIAEKLGCIRRAVDLPCTFLEDEAEFPELKRQLFANKMGDLYDGYNGSDHESERKLSIESSMPTRTDRASESDHSALRQDCNQMKWRQWQQQPGVASAPQESSRPSISNAFDQSQGQASMNSPVCSDFASAGAMDSPIFRAEHHYAKDGLWNTSARTDDYLAPSHVLDLSAFYMMQQQQQQRQINATIWPAMLEGKMGTEMWQQLSSSVQCFNCKAPTMIHADIGFLNQST